MVSQLTALSLLGVDGRRFLERVVPLCGGHVVPLGNLRLVSLDVAEAALHAIADAGDDVQAAEDGVGDLDEQPDTLDAVLAHVGRRRGVGSAR